MPVTTNSLLCLCMAGLLQAVPAQDPTPIAYPERDILSPFRTPTDLYAPSDELFRQLAIMQNISSRSGAKISFDNTGREVVDDPAWQQAQAKVNEIGIDAGRLASIIRLHRNAAQRDTAFYAAFYVGNISYVMNLISHIPGEPQRRTREAAFERAVQFLRAHLGRRFGTLTPDEQAVILAALPEIGSPAAKAKGLTRRPQENDYLHELRLVPFFQLLDVDSELDQAQALWFLKEVFTIRPSLANMWLEPVLPKLYQLLEAKNEKVRNEAIGIFQLIGPKKMGPPPSENEALVVWATAAAKNLFPPIRNINNAIVQIYPSKERDEIAKAGISALENSGIGDPFRGQKKDGSWYRGFRIGHVPDGLLALAIPAKSVITSVNGASIGNAQELLQTVKQMVQGQKPLRLIVEYVLNNKSQAVEFRIM